MTPRNAPRAKLSKKILVLIVFVATFVISFMGIRFLLSTTLVNQGAYPSANDIVAELKSQLKTPAKVDAITTLTDVTAGDREIVYHYSLSSDADTARLDNSSLKSSIAPKLCSTESTRKLVDKSITMTYLYVVEGSSLTYNFSVTKADCA